MAGLNIADLLVKIGGDTKDLTDALDDSQKRASGWRNKIAGSFKAVGKATVAAGVISTGALVVIGGAFAKLAIDAAPLQGVQDAFEGLAGAAGASSSELLSALQSGSAGMVTNKDLMTSFNKAAGLVSTDFAQTLPDAMGYFGKIAAATGQDVDYLMDSYVTGIGRMSPMILDNLQIQVTQADATQRAAEMFGKAAEELSKEEKQMGMANLALEKMAENTASMPAVTGSATQQMKKFSVSMQNAKDKIGMALLPIFTKLMGAVGTFADEHLPQLIDIFETRLVPFIEDNVVPALQELFAWFAENLPPALETASDIFQNVLLPAFGIVAEFVTGTVIPALAELWAFIQDSVIPAAIELATWFNDNVVPALQAVAGFIMETLVPALVTLVGWFVDNVVPALAKVADFLLDVLGPVVAEVSGFIVEQFGKAVEWVETHWPEIQATVETVMGFVQSVIETVLSAITDFWNTHGENILAFVSTTWESIQAVIDAAMNVIKGVIEAIMAAIQGDWDGAWAAIKEALSSVWSVMQTLVDTAVNAVKLLISLGLDAIAALWDIAWEAIRAAAEIVWDAIKVIVNTALKAIRTIIEFLLESAKSIISNIWDKVLEIISGVWEEIKGVVSSGLEAIISTITGVAGRLYDTGKAIVANLKQGISDAWGELVSWFNSRLGDLADLLPWSEPKKLSPLSGLAESGQAIVNNLLRGLETAMPKLQHQFSVMLPDAGGASSSAFKRMSGAASDGDSGAAVLAGGTTIYGDVYITAESNEGRDLIAALAAFA